MDYVPRLIRLSGGGRDNETNPIYQRKNTYIQRDRIDLQNAIVKGKYNLVSNIVTHCNINVLFDRNSVGVNSVEFAKLYGSTKMQSLIRARVKKDLEYKG